MVIGNTIFPLLPHLHSMYTPTIIGCPQDYLHNAMPPLAISMPNLIPVIMSRNPQHSRFPNDCYVRGESERCFPDEELIFSTTSQGPIYSVPSILCCHTFNEVQEPTFGPFSSSGAVYAPTVVTQFPDAFLQSPISPLSTPNHSKEGLVKGKPEPLGANYSRRKRQSVTHGPYKCSFCPKEIQRKYDLKRHVDTVHKKEKPFACRFEPCQRAFPRRDARDVITLPIIANESAET
jgi:hypothetical protein